MTIIYGESETGKSTFAISQIVNKENALYLLLDNDTSSIKSLKKNKIEFTIIENCHLIDIKYRLLENGGLIRNNLEYLVIDSINLIKDKKTYTEKIKYIEEISKDFNIKVVLVFNILKKMDKMLRFIDTIKDHRTINIDTITLESHLLL